MAKKQSALEILQDQYVGREGTYFPPIFHKEANNAGAMGFRVVVKDVRRNYGRLDFNVTPVEGTGLQWISSESVNLDEAKPEPSPSSRLASYLKPKKP